MSDKRHILSGVFVIFALTLTVGIAYLRAGKAEAFGRVALSETAIDFGSIPMENGPVSRKITVTNDGDADLEIHRLSTSCGCTTAEMDLSTMPPGEKRIMTVTFDPLVHPDVTGPIVRVVYLQTSDPESPEVEIDISGVVTKETNL